MVKEPEIAWLLWLSTDFFWLSKEPLEEPLNSSGGAISGTMTIKKKI